MFRYLISPIAMASVLNMGYASSNHQQTHLEGSPQETTSVDTQATNTNMPQSTNDNSKAADQLPKQQLDGVQPPENLKHNSPVNNQNKM